MSDLISRQDVYDALNNIKIPRNASWYPYYHQALTSVSKLQSVQPATNCSEIPNTSDFVSRKAVREMVATWSYDMAEWEDMELALHDVDELPPEQQEVIHCKDCKHRDPEDKKCDSGHAIQWQLPRSDDWFCADAERKEK